MKPDQRNNKNGQGPNNSNNNKRNMMGFLSIILWALVLFLAFQFFTGSMREGNTAVIPYSTFRQWVEDGFVDSVHVASDRFNITLKEGVEVSLSDDGEYLLSWAEEEDPSSSQSPESTPPEESLTPGEQALVDALRSTLDAQGDLNSITFATVPTISVEGLIELLDAHDVTYYEDLVSSSTILIQNLLSYVIPLLVMILAMVLLYRWVFSKMGSGGIGGIGGVGKANAKVYVEKSTGVTFKDVAGQDEAKESLLEIIDFLHNPQKYTEIGAKLPKGALLVGPPGTGKTLLAKAVAGEANVPFFSISGSDFVEMFVGVGASRVRDLFKEASKMAPCIVFIDEIDTIGKSRDNRMGGNDEREQTLNQLLAEMDGFDPTKGVILLAATNRPEVLDPALLRPGRFDRRITVDRPNLAGRLATLQVHTRKIRLAEDVDLNKIAQATAGCVGADLANMVNEAALRAVRLGRHAVNQEDLLVSFEVVIAGTEKKGTVITEQEKRIIAYHEVGHALAAAKQKNAQPVTKITIVPHTEGALGYTLHLPEEEKFLMSKEDILTEIRTLLAGRCAEELVFDTKTSGAANDIERATELARNLVARFGMSDKFGMMALGSVQSQYLDGGYSMNCAQETFAAADREVVELLQRCHDEAIELLRANREMLEAIAAYLLKKETITGQEMMAILEGRDPEQEEYYGVKSVQDNTIEAPAKHIHMTSEPIAMPAPAEEAPKAEEGSADPQ